MKKHYYRKSLLQWLIILAVIPFTLQMANAAPISSFSTANGWTQFADDDGVGSNGYVNPGWGGQAFDAEYLFYKLDGNTLSLGLQAGFDLETGKVVHSGKNYWAGDLALSFDGDASNYEYAVDFGLLTKDYNQNLVGGPTGINPAGLYSVTAWNTGVYYGFTSSNPFAMDSGDLKGVLSANISGDDTVGGDLSYYRIVSFNLSDIGIVADNGFALDGHWTMSCGNDAINGKTEIAPVPEPASMLLLGTGLVGLAGICERKRRRK